MLYNVTLLGLRYRHALWYDTKIVIKLFARRHVMAADVSFYGYSCAAKYYKITDYEGHYGCSLDSGANTSN